jgi:hypothetical protein
MRLISVAILASVAAMLASPAIADDVGKATRIQRFAYQTPPQAQKAPLYRLNPVVRNGRLETVASGALEVTFTDGSRLTLGSASSIVVDNYVFGASQGTGEQTLKMTRGLFRFVSGTMPKDKVKLQTPNVTIGIRGTVVKTKVNDDGSSTIFFEHGQGYVEDKSGKSVPMTEGDMVKVGADGSIGNPEHRNWSAGDAAVDDGLNPFGQSFDGPDGGSGGGDGAGSSSGSRNSNPG